MVCIPGHSRGVHEAGENRNYLSQRMTDEMNEIVRVLQLTSYDEDEWDAAMNVNVKGLWKCAKACVPAMKEQMSGSIINISSLAAVYGLPNCLHYTVSKAAVIGMTRGLARELGRYNIRVNTVAPNVVNTDATGEIFKDFIIIR